MATVGQSGAKPKSRRRILKRLAYVLFILAVVWSGDVLCGCYYSQLSETTGKQWVEFVRGNIRENDSRHVPHPYTCWTSRPNWNGQHNSAGYRGPELVAPKILTVGGSTTWGYCVDDYQQSWPWLIGESLNTEVANGGIVGAVSSEMLITYQLRYRHLGCKLVILHAGINDATPLWLDNYSPEYTHFRTPWRATTSTPRPGEEWLLKTSGTARLVYATWLSAGYSPTLKIAAPTYWSVEPEHALEVVKAADPVGFRRNVDLMVRDFLADGAKVLLVKEQLPSVEYARTHFCEPLFEPMVVGLAKDNQVFDDVGKKYGVSVIDIEIPDNLFVDKCHVGIEGEKLKADAIAKAIQDNHLLEPAQ